MDTAVILGMLFMFFLFVGLPIIVLSIIAHWKIFTKAGEEGWKCLIPVYNLIILLKIVGKPWWWVFLFMIPGLNIIWAIWTMNMLSKSFGKGQSFTVGLVLLTFIFLMILAFGDATYSGPFGDPVAFNNYRSGKGFDFDNNVLDH